MKRRVILGLACGLCAVCLAGAGLLLEQEWERARERSRRYGGLSRRLGLLLGLLAVVVLA